MTVTRYVSRKYRCPECRHEWQAHCVDASLPHDPCPQCTTSTRHEVKPLDRPVRSDVSKAVDFTYKMAEQDYGVTNMKDNLRVGDSAAIVDNDVSRAMSQRGGFYGSDGAPQAQVMSGRSSAMDMASAAKVERMTQGIKDPVSSLQKGLKDGNVPSIVDSTRRNPVARG